MMDRSIGLNKRWNTLVKNTKEFLFCCSFSTNMVLLQNGESVTTTSPQNTACTKRCIKKRKLFFFNLQFFRIFFFHTILSKQSCCKRFNTEPFLSYSPKWMEVQHCRGPENDVHTRASVLRLNLFSKDIGAF